MKKEKKNIAKQLFSIILIAALVITNITFGYKVDVNAETVHGTGALPDDPAKLAKHTINAVDETSVTAPNFPSKVDLSTTDYFPPIADQGSLGSCSSFATTYYQFTYEINHLRNTKADSSSRYYSPLFTYNYLNGGLNMGTSVLDNYNVLEQRGALTLSQFPYSTDYKTWPTDTQAMIDALKIRAVDPIIWDLNTSQYPITHIKSGSLNAVKSALNDDHVLVVCLRTDGLMSNMTQGTASNGEKIIYRCGNLTGGHSMTIVGYDDSVYIDVNQDGKIEAAERGAFKVANSWGTTFGNNGFIWVLYDALNTKSQISGQWESKQNISSIRRAIFDFYDSGNTNKFYQINVVQKNIDIVSKIEANAAYSKNFTVTLGKNRKNYPNFNITLTSLCKTNDTTTRKIVVVYDNSDFNADLGELLGTVTWSANLSTTDSTFHPAAFTNFNYSLVDVSNQTIAEYSSPNMNFNTQKNVNLDIVTNMQLGDVDFDFDVTMDDAQLVQKYALMIKEPSYLQSYLADFNQDGNVDMNDALAVLRRALRIE